MKESIISVTMLIFFGTAVNSRLKIKVCQDVIFVYERPILVFFVSENNIDDYRIEDANL
jgi:hypothetical protein